MRNIVNRDEPIAFCSVLCLAFFVLTHGYVELKFWNVLHDSVDRLLSLRFLQHENKIQMKTKLFG